MTLTVPPVILTAVLLARLAVEAALIAVLEAVATLAAILLIILAPLVGLRLVAGIAVLVLAVALAVIGVPVRLAALTLSLLVALLHVLIEGTGGVAAGGGTGLLLRTGDDAEVMLAVLEVVLGRDRVAGRQRIAGELGVLVGDVLSGAADLDVGTVRFVRARQRIRTLGAVTPAHPSILVRSHRSSVTLSSRQTSQRYVRDRARLRRVAPTRAARKQPCNSLHKPHPAV